MGAPCVCLGSAVSEGARVGCFGEHLSWCERGYVLCVFGRARARREEGHGLGDSANTIRGVYVGTPCMFLDKLGVGRGAARGAALGVDCKHWQHELVWPVGGHPHPNYLCSFSDAVQHAGVDLGVRLAERIPVRVGQTLLLILRTSAPNGGGGVVVGSASGRRGRGSGRTKSEEQAVKQKEMAVFFRTSHLATATEPRRPDTSHRAVFGVQIFIAEACVGDARYSAR